MAQIIGITSEALQATIRRLLPSQQGFGEDLQASNVIQPIIDLTPSAEGTTVPEYQQQALSFGNQTSFTVVNATTTIINTPGFFRVFGASSIDASANRNLTFSLSDGLSTKNIWRTYTGAGGTLNFDFIVFLNSGDSLSAQSSGTSAFLSGSTRQVADVNGVSVNPIGFTPQ